MAIMETTDEEADGQPLSRVAHMARKKELPWRSIPAAEVPKFVQAVIDEWSEWTKWSSCRPVHLAIDKIDPSLVLRSRVCYRCKTKDDSSVKPKARIVVAGFKDPRLPLLTRDAPVLSRAGLQCLLQWTASNKGVLYNPDCKSAFLQGVPDTERPEQIFMRPPSDDISKQATPDWSLPTLLYRLSAPVYGQANAPRRWFLHVQKTWRSLNWTPHSLDPCLWVLKKDGKVQAVLGLHVDDVLMSNLPGLEHLLEGVRTSFEWGGDWRQGECTFVGRHI